MGSTGTAAPEGCVQNQHSTGLRCCAHITRSRPCLFGIFRSAGHARPLTWGGFIVTPARRARRTIPDQYKHDSVRKCDWIAAAHKLKKSAQRVILRGHCSSSCCEGCGAFGTIRIAGRWIVSVGAGQGVFQNLRCHKDQQFGLVIAYRCAFEQETEVR
ncbi:MAG: hypothetical protein ACI9DC_000600 [Gammaproteobacteria bacterium]|jgi:hypothetical protein